MFHVKQATPMRTTRFPFVGKRATTAREMLIHASCAARTGRGVLLTGPPGSGKSDLLLRLLDRGFALVADDQVDIVNLEASPPSRLAGLLEIRGLGILRLPYVTNVKLALSVQLGRAARLPEPLADQFGLPLLTVDPALHSAPQRVSLALDCALGLQDSVSGAFSR